MSVITWQGCGTEGAGGRQTRGLVLVEPAVSRPPQELVELNLPEP